MKTAGLWVKLEENRKLTGAMIILRYVYLIVSILYLSNCNSKQTSARENQLNRTSEENPNPTEQIISDEFINAGRANSAPLNDIQSDYEFVLIDTFTIRTPKYKSIAIGLYSIKDWPDPGDFHRITITHRDTDTSFTNIDGWIKWVKEINAADQSKSEFVAIADGQKKSFILLQGYIYASEPGLLSIIDLESGMLIFNQNFQLSKFLLKNDEVFLKGAYSFIENTAAE